MQRQGGLRDLNRAPLLPRLQQDQTHLHHRRDPVGGRASHRLILLDRVDGQALGAEVARSGRMRLCRPSGRLEKIGQPLVGRGIAGHKLERLGVGLECLPGTALTLVKPPQRHERGHVTRIRFPRGAQPALRSARRIFGRRAKAR